MDAKTKLLLMVAKYILWRLDSSSLFGRSPNPKQLQDLIIEVENATWQHTTD